MTHASLTTTDLPFEVAAAVTLEVLFLEGPVSDVDEVFEEGCMGDLKCKDSDLNESTKI